MKNFIILMFVFALAFVAWFYINSTQRVPTPLVTSFEGCSLAGYPIIETSPRQCNTGKHIFIEAIKREVKKNDLIRVTVPQPNQKISSPITITGEARGNWFFEASFPVVITDWDGKIIGQGVAQAKSDWMTTDFVPFEATLTFKADSNAYNNKGTLILRKDNPSGLPKNDNSLEIPVVLVTTNIKEIPPHNSGIRGTIFAGPTCPVERMPPEPKCADRPVETNISVYRAIDKTHSIAMLESSANGMFEISLPRGDYIVMAGPYGVPFPRCPDTSVTVGVKGYTQITISCDTGIR